MSIGGGGGYINVDSAGSVPAANPVVGGASGIVTGTERERVQGLGTLIEAMLAAAGNVALATAPTWTTVASLTLTPGTWLVYGHINVHTTAAGSGAVGARLDVAPQEGQEVFISSAANSSGTVHTTPTRVVVPSGTQVVNLQGTMGGGHTGVTASGTGWNLGGTRATGVHAVREA